MSSPVCTQRPGKRICERGEKENISPPRSWPIRSDAPRCCNCGASSVMLPLLPCEPRVLRDVFDRGAHAVDVQNAVKLRTVRKSARWAVAGAGLRLCVVAVGPPVPARRRCHRNKKQSHFILVVTAGRSSRPSTGRCTTVCRSRSLPM